jgi:AraC family transcriptional regulator
MSFLSDFENVLDYIEDNLTSEIDIEVIAQKMKCTTYHFQRMFSFLTNVPLSEYIRKRKMTMAAFELQNANVKVIDIAIKYGYDSHSSFTRAFQSVQGITPSKSRMDGVCLTTYPKISFIFKIKGDSAMKYQVIKMKPQQLFGLNPLQIDGWETQPFLDYADSVIEDGTHDAINIAAGFPGNAIKMIQTNTWDVSKIHLLYAIHFFDETGKKHIMYGWEYPQGGVEKQFTVINVPESMWVVITDRLDGERDSIKKCYEDLYMNWFPSSGYNQAPNLPIIEKYNLEKSELWIPIERKQI